MATLSTSHFSFCTISRLPSLQYDNANSIFIQNNMRETGAIWMSLVVSPQARRRQLGKLNRKGICNFDKSVLLYRNVCTYHVSLVCRMRSFFHGAFSRLAFSAFHDETKGESGSIVGKLISCGNGFNRVDSLVQILHESAKSFSTDIQNHELSSGQLELAKAWVGVDVNSWYKHIAYQAAVYALLNTATEARLFPFGECSPELSLVRKVISPGITMICEHIDGQLTIRDPRLAYWFKTVQLPILEAQISLRHAEEESKSGVAVIIRAICCCVAIESLGAARVSCPMLTINIPQIVEQLMDSLHKLVGIDELHSLAYKAGLEQEFLSHFGTKIVLNSTSQDAVFWITMVHKKLVVAFHREGVISEMQGIYNTKDLETGLATLGLFAWLGRNTRLFLCSMGIDDLAEEVQDFLSYLECAGVLIYPELSSLTIFQLFMEVVVEECGWVNFYATIPYTDLNDRRWSKQHTFQAEKEIILSAVFKTCSDVFSAFEHYQTSTRQSFDMKVAAFFQQSQVLLSVCLEDYWAAYYKSGELLKTAEISLPDPVLQPTIPRTTDVSIYSIVLREIVDFFIPGYNYNNIVAQTIKSVCAGETRTYGSLLRKSIDRLICISCDIMKGTHLLFIDISMSSGLLFKCIYSGHNLTELQTKKLSQTIADFGAVIPITVLMLIPVSVVGHAAILAAIKKYVPSLIPSPYSSERLGLVKQLNRIKKMETETWMNNYNTQ